MWKSLKRGIILEAIQYLFLIPFIIQWVIFSSGIRTYETIFSFSIQILLITPTLFILYQRLNKPQTNQITLLKGISIAGIAFMFAMWIKHFFFNLYALPLDFSNSILTLGFVNSAITLLVSALILVAALLPFIRGKSAELSFKGIGAALVVASIYFIVYYAVAAVNPSYESFLLLTELWMVSLLIVGVGFLIGKK